MLHVYSKMSRTKHPMQHHVAPHRRRVCMHRWLTRVRICCVQSNDSLVERLVARLKLAPLPASDFAR